MIREEYAAARTRVRDRVLAEATVQEATWHGTHYLVATAGKGGAEKRVVLDHRDPAEIGERLRREFAEEEADRLIGRCEDPEPLPLGKAR